MSDLRGALWLARLAFSSRVLGNLRELRRFERYDAAEIEHRQARLLEGLLVHAHEHVPYYRRVLGEVGVVRDGRVDLTRFSDVPVLEKATVRERFDELTADDLERGRVHVNSTGGSTGEPVRFLQDRSFLDWRVATKMLFNRWAGVRPGAKTLLLWGAEKDLAANSGSWKRRVGSWLRNEVALNAYHMSEAEMRDHVDTYNAFRPEIVLAYAQSMYQWARFVEAAGLVVSPPKAIMTSATNLDPVMRETIQRVFGAPVFDRYGSREVSDVACENGDGLGLVVSPRTHIVETVGPDGSAVAPGHVGDVLVTVLTNYAMPLIRYRIGDAAALADGPVGAIAWPRLTEIAGRVTDIFYTRDGKQIYGGYFTRMFYRVPSVAQFQVVQEAYDHIVLRVVPAASAAATLTADLDGAVAKIRAVMGAPCRVDVERVAAITPGPSGKRRYTISHVEPPTTALEVPAS